MPRCVLLLLASLYCLEAAAQFDPPPGYYESATGAGSQLKSQLHDIIDGHVDLGYNALRTMLQVTDEDPDNPGHILLVYDRTSLDLSGIGGSIPGWDNGNSWNREHTWPRSRGVDSSGPDNSDLHNHRPSDPQINADRASLNFGGEYGAQPYGFVSDGGTKWYPGDADAGMIARQEFYMAVRYDGSDFATTDLELAAGDPGGARLGDLSRLLEWHFAAPPDEFEQRRNHLVHGYQGNRNPFVDHPEYAWSVLVDQANDSQITIQGGVDSGSGGSTRSIDLGRVYVGGPGPEQQTLTLNKSGFDGTYFQVTTTGAATSSLTGRHNAFRTGRTDSMAVTIGLDAVSAAPGDFTGSVVFDNLDITSGAADGRAALDADDVVTLGYSVLEHPVASFSAEAVETSLSLDLGVLTHDTGLQSLPPIDLYSYAGAGGPEFASLLELDSALAIGNAGPIQLEAGSLLTIPQGSSAGVGLVIDTSVVGDFTAAYELQLSGEDLPGDQTQTLVLMLTASVVVAHQPGDFNGDGLVDAADYTVWRDAIGTSSDLNGAGVDDGVVDQLDYQLWQNNYGVSSNPATDAAPEPAACLLLLAALWPAATRKRRRSASLRGERCVVYGVRNLTGRARSGR